MRDQLNTVKSPGDIAKVLNGSGIRYRETNNTRTAESLPIEALPRIAKMNKGDTITFTDQNLTNVLMLMDYAEQPVTLERATPLIQQYLLNQKKREVAQAKLKELRAKGMVEYVGSFAKAAGDAKSAEAGSAALSAPAPAEGLKESHIEKGISGLR